MKIENDAAKRVLVTGAAGFIGRHCLPFLVSNGCEVHAVDRVIPETVTGGVYWHEADLLNNQETNHLMTSIRPTYLLHLAWFAKPGEYWNSTENIRWVEESLHLLRSFQQVGGKRVVMAGTCAEYDWANGYCSEYETPLAPSTLYGTCKNALQHILDAFSKTTGLSSAWGRIFFLYGPYENPGRLISSVILNLLKNRPALCTRGNQIRDFMYVKDVASAFISLLMSDVEGPVNIASGTRTALKEVILLISEKLNKRNLIRLGALPQKENDPPVLFGDINRLSREVGWQQQYDIDTGIEETINWWQERCNNESETK
jgi:nucleoside-diphosphate-sugar epimerase